MQFALLRVLQVVILLMFNEEPLIYVYFVLLKVLQVDSYPVLCTAKSITILYTGDHPPAFSSVPLT